MHTADVQPTFPFARMRASAQLADKEQMILRSAMRTVLSGLSTIGSEFTHWNHLFGFVSISLMTNEVILAREGLIADVTIDLLAVVVAVHDQAVVASFVAVHIITVIVGIELNETRRVVARVNVVNGNMGYELLTRVVLSAAYRTAVPSLLRHEEFRASVVHSDVTEKLRIIGANFQTDSASESCVFFVGGTYVEPERGSIVEVTRANFANEDCLHLEHVVVSVLMLLFLVIIHILQSYNTCLTFNFY